MISVLKMLIIRVTKSSIGFCVYRWINSFKLKTSVSKKFTCPNIVCLFCGLMSQSTIFQSSHDRDNAFWVLISTSGSKCILNAHI